MLFLDQNRNSYQALTEFLEQAAFEEARMLVHSITGGAGICVNVLQHEASALELACRAQNKRALLGLMPIFRARLEDVLSGLSELSEK